MSSGSFGQETLGFLRTRASAFAVTRLGLLVKFSVFLGTRNNRERLLKIPELLDSRFGFLNVCQVPLYPSLLSSLIKACPSRIGDSMIRPWAFALDHQLKNTEV